MLFRIKAQVNNMKTRGFMATTCNDFHVRLAESWQTKMSSPQISNQKALIFSSIFPMIPYDYPVLSMIFPASTAISLGPQEGPRPFDDGPESAHVTGFDDGHGGRDREREGEEMCVCVCELVYIYI